MTNAEEVNVNNELPKTNGPHPNLKNSPTNIPSINLGKPKVYTKKEK